MRKWLVTFALALCSNLNHVYFRELDDEFNQMQAMMCRFEDFVISVDAKWKRMNNDNPNDMDFISIYRATSMQSILRTPCFFCQFSFV